jgi:hypothetical protein
MPYPPNAAGCPWAASNPDETRMKSGLNVSNRGMTRTRQAALE